MKHFGWVVILILLVGCGEEGDSNVTFSADYRIVALQLSGIGVHSDDGYYDYTVYKARPGLGLVIWTDGTTTWFEDVNIKEGGDPQLWGLLTKDGKDALTTLYFGIDFIRVYGVSRPASIVDQDEIIKLLPLIPLGAE